MHFVNIAFFLLAAIGQSAANVELRKGVNQTVVFEGQEVEIQVKRESGSAGPLVICFGSTPETSYSFCPKGYAMFSSTIAGGQHILRVDRQGHLTEDSDYRTVAGSIQFNYDGAVNILVKELPDDETTVILPNAENLIISGIVVYFYINRRKKNPMPLGSPQEGLNSDKSMENTRVLTNPVVVKPQRTLYASPQSPAKPTSKPMALSPIKSSDIKTMTQTQSMTHSPKTSVVRSNLKFNQ
uniref:Secreted protein n=1 Tax=Panagrellus redivivus TaxID=6233 RepID=A0A7E4V9H2_PANRE